MTGRPSKMKREQVRKRFELHLRPADKRLLQLLVELEGGNETAVARRAIALYCERVEALEKQFENLTPKGAK